MKLFPALFAIASAGLINIDTDEWLTAARLSVGSQNETAFLTLDFNQDITIIPGMSDCGSCKVKTYDYTVSTTRKPGLLHYWKVTYRRSTIDPLLAFNGYTIKDRICFNAGTTNAICSDTADRGFDFFVV
jgi:hypothetical protein